MNRKICIFVLAIGSFFLTGGPAAATHGDPSRVRAATGGESISADTFASGAWTSLKGPTLQESAAGQIGAGSIIISAPSGFAYRTAAKSVQIKTSAAYPSQNSFKIWPTAACTGGGASEIAVTPAPGAIQFFVCSSSAAAGNKNTVRFSGVSVRPAQGTPLAQGALCYDPASTSVIADIHPCGSASPTSFGWLKEVPGSTASLALSPRSTTIGVDASQTYVAHTADQFGNSLGTDVTSSTIFSIQPDGACVGATCNVDLPVPHTVTGLSGGLSGTADLLVTAPPAPGEPEFEVVSETSSTMLDGNGKRVFAIPNHDRSDLTVIARPTCTGSVSPQSVTVLLGDTPYPALETPPGSGSFTATIPAAELVEGPISVFWTCGATSAEHVLGGIELYDPTGLISKYVPPASGASAMDVPMASMSASSTDSMSASSASSSTTPEIPIPGAEVTLYRVPTYTPETFADDDPTTCQTPLTRSSQGWTQPPPSDPSLSEPSDPLSGLIEPRVNPFITNANGIYGWNVARGCYYIVVRAEGFRTKVSPMVGVPPEVLDLHVSLVEDAIPDTSIVSGPSGATTSRTANVSFRSTDPEAAFDCSLDGGAFGPCASPAAYSGLQDGTHTFSVRSTSPTGKVDPSPATISWLVDASVPEVEFLKPSPGHTYAYGNEIPAGPEEPAVLGPITLRAKVTSGPSAVSAFEFRVNGQRVDPNLVTYNAASSTYQFTYNATSPGRQTIDAIATSGSGLVGSDRVVLVVVLG
ncbi:MAG TPA: hypothetical protein VNE62_02050 [Actinomycetota bacterium]|nr:hypothetical protein [Actinomycetota bacterium]